MWYRDPFLIYLTGLLVLLMGRQGFLFWKNRPVSGGDGVPSLLAGCAACFSLFAVMPVFQAFWLGLYLALRGGDRQTAPFLAYSVIALLFFGLYPDVWSLCLVMPLLFWPGSGPKEYHSARGIAYCLAVGYGFKDSAPEPLFWFLGMSALVLVMALWIFFRRPAGSLLSCARFCALTRSLLLVGLLQFALQSQLYEGAEAALCALLLDVTCQVASEWGPQWRSFVMALPLLPGFVTLWFGLHAALALVGPDTSWTILGLGLGLVIGVLSLAETLLVAVTLPSVRVDGSFMGVAALLGCLVPAMALPMTSYRDGLMVPGLHEFGPWIVQWLGEAPHQIFLVQPVLWFLWMVLWVCLVHPRLSWRKMALFVSCPAGLKMACEGETLFPSHLPFPSRRFLIGSVVRYGRLLWRQGIGLHKETFLSLKCLFKRWREGEADFSLSVWILALVILVLMAGLAP